MRMLLCTIGLAATLNFATGLECFVCVASLTSDCSNGISDSMIETSCPSLARNTASPGTKIDHFVEDDNVPIVARCISFAINAFGMTFVERGCRTVYENIDICEFLEEHNDIIACSHCSENLCNNDALF